MKLALLALLAHSTMVLADIPEVSESVSPDGKFHGVMDVDRDPRISPEWKGDSYPRIEVTEKATGRVLVSIEYFGAGVDDARPLREHVRLRWRPDSKAFAITIDDRFYSSSKVFALNKESKFVEVAFPSYEKMTGFPLPDSKHLRPRGRATVLGWDENDQLIYDLFASPLPTFTGNDPLIHRVSLKVSETKMTAVKVENESGEWQRGEWIRTKAEQGGADQPATRCESKSEGNEQPNPESEGRSR
ncbi:MAG TPA: hypothetical protein VMN36_10940 [Verrucomicrobiales bacterium]|nr:hypothetical protein [Verrucomicrobiales bacterium]